MKTQKACFKCLKKVDTTRYYISNRGYGSYFDGMKSHVDLCDNCSSHIKEEWFYEFPTVNYYIENYQYEDLLLKFIDSLPLKGQDAFWFPRKKGENWWMLF